MKTKRVIKINESQLRNIIKESVMRVLRESDGGDEEFGNISWGENIEEIVNRLSEIFGEYNVAEEDEFGMMNNEFDNLISHLKYYYDIDVFNGRAFNAIYKLLENYPSLKTTTTPVR